MIKRSVTKLLVRAVLLASLLLGGTTAAFASQIIFVGTNPDGSTVWVSFGSSAGYYVMKCPAGGGPCEDVTPAQ